MSEISFEDFCKRLDGSSDEELRAMARESSVVFAPNLGRSKLLVKMYEAYSQETQENVPEKEEECYQVKLTHKADRWRGGRKWARGVNLVPIKDLDEELLKALENDPKFKVQKIKVLR